MAPRSSTGTAGNGRLNAHYMLQAFDGTMIYIHNTGYIYPKNGKAIDRNDPSWGGDSDFYFRITQVLMRRWHHDWLTRTVIVGTRTETGVYAHAVQRPRVCSGAPRRVDHRRRRDADPADMCKLLALGADCVMVGSALAAPTRRRNT